MEKAQVVAVVLICTLLTCGCLGDEPIIIDELEAQTTFPPCLENASYYEGFEYVNDSVGYIIDFGDWNESVIIFNGSDALSSFFMYVYKPNWQFDVHIRRGSFANADTYGYPLDGEGNYRSRSSDRAYEDTVQISSTRAGSYYVRYVSSSQLSIEDSFYDNVSYVTFPTPQKLVIKYVANTLYIGPNQYTISDVGDSQYPWTWTAIYFHRHYVEPVPGGDMQTVSEGNPNYLRVVANR